MERKPLSQAAPRWWLAPTRFAEAPLTLLRKAVQHYYPQSDTWVRHAPVGIRAQATAELGAPSPR
jgi:hypothetical protein